MKTAIILAIQHDGKKAVMVSGPEIPIVKQLEKFKELKRQDTDPKNQCYQLWVSDSGIEQQRYMMTPAEAKAKAEARAKAEAEAKAKAEATKNQNVNPDSKNAVLKTNPTQPKQQKS